MSLYAPGSGCSGAPVTTLDEGQTVMGADRHMRSHGGLSGGSARLPTRACRLGWRLLALVADTWEVSCWRPRAPMAALVHELDETVRLCVLQGTQVVTLQSHSAAHGFRATGRTRMTVPAR
jgi:hypothetical protein